MNAKNIILISCGHFEKNVLDEISADLSLFFKFPLEVRECTLDLSSFYNPTRRQYNANMILTAISQLTSQDAIKTIALMRVDIFIPILTSIFGQSILNGNTGIVSLYRLRNELYGLEQDNRLLIERFRKVIVHELGHEFGLVHCHKPTCIMRSTTYDEILDQKDLVFCNQCNTLLDARINGYRI